MPSRLLMQLLALSLYAWWMGFCFCDGFRLHILRKLVWFVFFGAVAAAVLKTTGEYDLAIILPAPCLLALFLAWRQLLDRTKSGKK